MEPVRSILLVEDNADHEALALRALRRSHVTCEIDVARDGAEALSYLLCPDLHTPRPPVGLVLLDLKLPKVDGLDVLRRLRAHAQTVLLPVIVLSSSDEDRDIAASYECGANSYLLKPVNYLQFLEVARQLGLYWLDLNQAPPGR